MPERIQRQRTKGWKMPGNTVYVGRPTKWGNTRRHLYPSLLVALFRSDLMEGKLGPITAILTPEIVRAELRGKNLACWCPLDQPCHADVLLEIANNDIEGEKP